eukprot:CAMPEP_0203789142 /NCGR_PEP_ID=MMETSP0100_2-20121128/3253_1 /ASSEMBLY_ACC=CAM_ASM_000210 /TAXON_ID=96639 /ORGANISM=" , Strain NY0313808BC1" /LENGTH=460 /DNA_ID=CAMNT_0050691993 /DNA_START=533 /DNA_END=1912 /DNA_ORIENTATION=+
MAKNRPEGMESPGEVPKPRLSLGPDRLPVCTKWFVLVAAMIVEAGGSYVVDLPSATHNQLETYFASGDPSKFEFLFNMMYSSYSIPGIIVPLITGVISDKLGDVILYPLCAFISFVGAAGVALGVEVNSPSLILVSRLIYGTGFPGIFLLNCVLVSKWFLQENSNNSHLALALALLASANRSGTAINNLISPRLCEHVSLQFAYWFAVIICVCRVLCSFYISSLEKKRRIFQAQSEQVDIERSNTHIAQKSIWQSIQACPLMFWVVLGLIAIFYGTVAASNSVSAAYLIERLCNGTCCLPDEDGCEAEISAENTASFLMNIPLVFCIVLGPLVGIGLDHVGHMAWLIVGSTCLFCGAFALYTFSSVSVCIAMVIEGISIACFASASWPCIPKIVDKSVLGVAFGLIACAYSAGLTLFPMLVSVIRAATTTYETVQALFFVVSCIMFSLSLYLCRLNYTNE